MDEIMEELSNHTGLSVGKIGGIVLIALGALLFVGAIFKWEWVLDSRGSRRSFLRSVFGMRGSVFISSSIIIIVGIFLLIFA